MVPVSPPAKGATRPNFVTDDDVGAAVVSPAKPAPADIYAAPALADVDTRAAAPPLAADAIAAAALHATTSASATLAATP